jgi:hypothetical protein
MNTIPKESEPNHKSPSDNEAELESSPVSLGFASEKNIDLEIAELESVLARASGSLQILFYILGGAALLGSILMFFGGQISKAIQYEPLYNHSALIGIALFSYALCGIAVVAVMRQTRISSVKQEIDVLRARKRIFGRALVVPVANTSAPSYFDRLVDINVTNLEAYYGLVKVHTNNSFLFAMSAGCIGFVLVVTGLIVGFTSSTNAQAISYISAGSGVVTEFIAGVFFYLYNRTVRQLKEYHDSLIRVQNILLSFKIVGDTRDEKQRNVMMELMMKCLITTEPNSHKRCVDDVLSEKEKN